MQYHRNPRFGTEVFGHPGMFERGLGSCLKQQIEEPASVSHDHGIELVRQSEHHVVIGSGQDFMHPVFYPCIPFHAAAVWTVPVPAAMVTVCHVSAFLTVTPAEMVTFGSGMAGRKVRENRPAVWIEVPGGMMSEQGLEGGIIFHHRADQEVIRVYPCAAW